jgi:predicted nucleic acid-binding protein
VTVAEVLIGIRDHARHARAVQALVAGTVLPALSPEDWIMAGSSIARLGGDAVTTGRSFWNDALLAAQCASVGATLVTTNTADFRRLTRYIPVKVAAPFP